MNDFWAPFTYPSTILVDEDIIRLGESGLLISKGFDRRCVAQTSYHLRVGEKAYSWSRNEYIDISQTGPLRIRPREVLNILTLEEVKFPPHVIGRICSLVGLVSAGISHTSTYIDPGFEGHLRISIVNHSARAVVLKYGDSLVRVEFEVLGKPVQSPHTGVHRDPGPKVPITADIQDQRQVSEEDLDDPAFFKKEGAFFGEPFDVLFGVASKVKDRLAHLEGELARLSKGEVDELQRILKTQAQATWLTEWQRGIKRETGIASAVWGGLVGAVATGLVTAALRFIGF